jgi:hypothetical protein
MPTESYIMWRPLLQDPADGDGMVWVREGGFSERSLVAHFRYVFQAPNPLCFQFFVC